MPRIKTTKSIFTEVKCVNDFDIVTDEVEIPELDKNGVLIKVKACALPSAHYDPVAIAVILPRMKNQRLGLGSDISGIVQAIGSDVTTLSVGDSVVGIIPLDYGQSGCSEYVVLEEFDVVIKPPGLSFVDAAGCIGDSVKAYTALHYLGRLTTGDTVLILDGASSFGSICVQLAHHWGARVLTTASSDDEKTYLQALGKEVAHVIEIGHINGQKSSSGVLRSAVMLETGGLGVDIILDNRPVTSQRNVTYEDNKIQSLCFPSKHELISCLAVGGRWVTSKANLQLDPPNSRLLFLRSASVGYLFEQAWMLSNAQQGRYQHILMDIIEKVATNMIRPNIHHTVPFDAILEEAKSMEDVKVGKVVMLAT